MPGEVCGNDVRDRVGLPGEASGGIPGFGCHDGAGPCMTVCVRLPACPDDRSGAGEVG